MINISPTVRIVLGVLITLMGLLCLAGTAGLFANEGSAIEAERDTLTRLLATHYANALQQDKRPAIEESLRQLIVQSPELRSVTLRGDAFRTIDIEACMAHAAGEGRFVIKARPQAKAMTVEGGKP